MTQENNQDRAKAIEMIRKMMELANPENGGFEGEIAAASAMIQKLIDKHCIEDYELFTEADRKIEFESLQTDVLLGKAQAWQLSLSLVIARITHTRSYTSWKYDGRDGSMNRYNDKKQYSGRVVNFYGTPENVKLAVELFNTWVFRLDSMAREATSFYCKLLVEEFEPYGYKNAYHISGLGNRHPNVYRNSWLAGCLDAMNASISQSERERSANVQSGLVRYDANMAAAWADFAMNFRKSSAVGQTRTNYAGYNAGSEVGRSINIGSRELDK